MLQNIRVHTEWLVIPSPTTGGEIRPMLLLLLATADRLNKTKGSGQLIGQRKRCKHLAKVAYLSRYVLNPRIRAFSNPHRVKAQGC